MQVIVINGHFHENGSFYVTIINLISLCKHKTDMIQITTLAKYTKPIRELLSTQSLKWITNNYR